jgi:anti-anti-sigma factor
MKVRRRDDGDVTILEFSGMISGGSDSYDFEHIVADLMDDNRWNTVLQFKNVKWINSTGIGILVRNYSHYVRHGGQMVVAELNTRVSIVFDRMIRKVFEVHETSREAVEVLKNRSSAPVNQKEPASAPR